MSNPSDAPLHASVDPGIALRALPIGMNGINLLADNRPENQDMTRTLWQIALI